MWFAWVGLVVVLDGLGFKKACDGYQLFRVLARLGHSEGGSLLSKIMAHIPPANGKFVLVLDE